MVIARALANNPAIVSADEPTGNLDGRAKFEIIRSLGRLNVERGTTVIMAIHDSWMASQAAKVLFLSDGKLLEKEKKGLRFMEEGITCPRCRWKLPAEAEYCFHCGAKL